MYFEEFIQAIQNKNKIRITYYSKEFGGILTKNCAPMDYGPSRRFVDKNERFHFWDYDSETPRHSLNLLPQEIYSMEILNETFNPADFIIWNTANPPWFVKRDWGKYS